jgi:nucleotide-binding universal stress UspA family protein
MKRILVPTDFSEPAAAALRYASALAARFDAELAVLHADPFIPAIDFTAIPAGEFDLAQRRLVDLARLRLNAHAQTNVNPLVSWDATIAISDPVNAIVNASNSDYDLVVMGTHGRTGMNRMIFGSVTAAVMRLASAPVLAVHGDRRSHIHRVAWTGSGSYLCREALRVAEHLAPGASVSIIPGEARAEDIVAFAKLNDIDLIALGVPADRRVLEMIQGTVAEKLVRLTECPVVTVNARAAEAVAVAEVTRALTS